MNNQSDKLWWRPLGRRIFRWGLWGALIINGVPWLLVAWFASQNNFFEEPRSNSLSDLSLRDTIIFSLLAGAFYTSPIGLMGSMVGWASGFYAPPAEPTHPLQSSFFRTVAAQSLLVWLASCAVIGAGAAFYYFFVWRAAKLSPYALTYSVLGAVAVVIIAFGFCLWRGVNCALRAE